MITLAYLNTAVRIVRNGVEHIIPADARCELCGKRDAPLTIIGERTLCSSAGLCYTGNGSYGAGTFRNTMRTPV